VAGLGLGILLRTRGVPVTIHEAAAYPRHRVCGEFVAGRGAEILTGLELPGLSAKPLRLRATRWWGRRGERFDAPLPRAALGVSRHTLDAALAGRFQDLGGELLTGSRAGDDLAPAGTVWATGRRAGKSRRWIGLKCHAGGFALGADLEMFLGQGAYAGASRVEGDRVNIAGLFPLRTDISAPRDALMPAYLRAHGMHGFADRVSAARVDPASCCGVSAFDFAPASLGPRRLEIGDARLVVPPFTGNGISLALEHASAIAPVLEAWSHGALGWETALDRAHACLGPFDARVRRARWLQRLLLAPRGQGVLWGAARAHVLPFATFFHLLH